MITTIKAHKEKEVTMKAYKIDNFIPQNDNKPFITKFGGQPDWIANPQ